MKKNIYLLLVLIGLFLGISLVLNVIYGPSYPFLQGEDCWLPDGDGGWLAHGSPADPMPDIASENVPLVVPYLPFLIPGFVLALFMFTPLRHKLETPLPESGTPVEDDEAEGDDPDADDDTLDSQK